MKFGRRMTRVGLAAAGVLCSSLVLASIFGAAVRPERRAGVKLGEEFKLGIGKTAALEGEGVEIEFVSVVEDSRCPRGVDCIWEGNAKVRLRLKSARRPPAEIELNTNVEPQRAATHGYEIRLTSLSPYPQGSAAIDKKSYVASLEVRKP